MADDAVLRVEDLTVALPPGGERAHAVEKISFTLDRREILCIVGESGSGKSLTAAAVMRLLPRSVHVVGGRILLGDTDLLALSEAEMRAVRGNRIGMIFQEPMTALNPLMRVGDQIGEILANHTDLGARARRARIVEAMRAVNLPEPEHLRHVYPFRLSGGQRQRVMIAMALALAPSVLIADEPTTALDVTTQKQILTLIKDLQQAHEMGVLFITHDFGVVAEIADRVAVMQHGLIVEQGPAERILNAPEHPYTQSLVRAVPKLEPRTAEDFAGRPILLEAKALSKTYVTRGGLFVRRREVKAVQAVDLTIASGETLGVVGESGSGKSTLGRLIVDLVPADGGSLRFDGADLLAGLKRGDAKVRRDVQMVFQDPYASLNPRHRVRHILTAGPLAHGVPKKDALARAIELLRLVGLDAPSLDRYPHEFSGGQRQRIGIARALALDPKLLIADEPVSALDVSVQAQILELFNDIRRRLALSMLFITHDLRVAAQVADRIAVMQNGVIVETAPAADIFRRPEHPYTRALIDAVPGKHWVAPVLTA